MTSRTAAPAEPVVRPSRRAIAVIAGGAVIALACAALALFWLVGRRSPLPAVSAVPQEALPAHTWLSGAWTGSNWSPDRIAAFGAWRGSPVDTATAYPAYGTWAELRDSNWNVAVFDGFPGRLVYGLPLLPTAEGSGTLADVAAGRHDDAFTAVAATLVRHHRGDAFVRIGLEANGDWFPWGVGRQDDPPGQGAAAFKAAFAHVAGVLKANAPDLTIVFDIGCGHALSGQSDRLDSLTRLYPGDGVVDVIGCDHYDAYSTISRTAAQWAYALRPPDAAGLQDVVDFARAHGKPFAIPEWGLTAVSHHGGGDNPFFVYQMYRFLAANRSSLAFENYFNEPDAYLQSSIWGTVQNPRAAAEYARLW